MRTSAPALVERERELAALEAALAGAARGHGRTVAVAGRPGIGKSRLLAAARERGRAAGMLVCSARGAELEHAFPFGVVRQLAASSFADSTRDERESWFVGVARMARPLFAEEAILDASAASYARLHALYWLCANAARRRPLVLVVDDAQWADDASLAFAGFLARRVAELPLLLLLGARSPDPARAAELVRVLADAETTTLVPDPLSLAGVTALVRAIAGVEPEPAFAEACRRATDGNPFLVGELAREIAAAGIEPTAARAGRVASLTPSGVRATTLLRLGRLDPAARRLARTLALLDDDAALPVVAELAGLDATAALDAAGDLEHAGLVTRDPGLRFVHPLLRAAVADDVPAVERAAAHAAAARTLAENGAAPPAVAAHLLCTEASGEPWVLRTLRDAARLALALGDPQAAAEYLRRALDEPAAGDDRAGLLLDLGLAEARTRPADAVARLREATAVAGTVDARVTAALRLAQLLNVTGRADEAAHVLEDGIAAAAGRPDLGEPLWAELIATAYVRVSSRELLDPLIRSLRAPDGPPGTPLELAGTAALAVEHAVARGDPATGAELARRVLARRERPVHPPLALALVAAEELDEAEIAVTTELAGARGAGSVVGVAVASGARAAIRLARDDLLGAEADALACLELLGGEPGTEAIAMGAAATAVRAGVELGRAEPDLAATVASHAGDPDLPTNAFLLLADGALRAAAGDFGAALERFERCGAYAWGRDCPALFPWRSASAGALARLGRGDEARERAAEELELARTAATPRALGVALHAAAVVARDDAERELWADEAVAALERAQAPLQLGRALVTRGALRRRSGRRTLARADLQRAHDLATPRGAVRLADAAAAELASSGVRLRPPAGAGVDALTPSERRVAELAAEGLSNRDIAEALFLSEKTVEAHLGRGYRKLGIRSRTRLAAALGPGR